MDNNKDKKNVGANDQNKNDFSRQGGEGFNKNKTAQDFTSENRDINRSGGQAGGNIPNPSRDIRGGETTQNTQSSDINKKDLNKK